MTSINDAPEDVRAAIGRLYADASADGSVSLEHYGTKGMKWGVRSQETLRKYGLLAKTAASKAVATGSAKAKSALSSGAAKASQVAKVKMAAAKASAKTASKATADKAKAAAKAESTKAKTAMAAKKAQVKAEHQAKKQQKAEEKAYRKEIGMSKRDFDKLRETALKSHDPEVVAKGMHTLTDKELNAKLYRLSTESKISGMAYANQKNAETIKKSKAEAREQQMKAIKASPLYDVLATPVKNVTTDIIQEQLYKSGFQPILNAKVSSKRDSVLEGMGLLAKDDKPSGADRVGEAIQNAQKQMKTDSKPKGETREASSKSESSPKPSSTIEAKLNNIGAKVVSKSIYSGQQRAEAERAKAKLTAERIDKAQKAFDDYDRVVEAGRVRNTANAERASAPKPPTKVDLEPRTKATSNPAAEKKDARRYSSTSGKQSTSYTQRTRRPDVHASNIGSISPGIVEAAVASSSSKRSSRSSKKASRR